MMSQAVIEVAVNELADEFYQNPDEFFNEHDFHHLFFCKLYPKFKHLIHPEYPTRKRFIKEKASDEEYSLGKHCYGPEIKKGVRGHYDFAVFKEEFYNKHKNALDRFDRLSNKNVNTNLDSDHKYIDFAIEFKYITSGSISVIKEIEFDIFKLQNAEEAENKYLIIFIKKIFSDRGFKQIIGPLNKFQADEKNVEILIFSK
jgi:hypothetical protein